MSFESTSPMITQRTTSWNQEVLLKSPFFSPLWSIVAQLGTAGFPSLGEMNLLLVRRPVPITVESGAALRFVMQSSGKLPFEAQYEPSCYLRGEVPTRAENWHDLFNALVWLTFPKAKAAMNARHYRVLTHRGAENEQRAGSERGALRDVTTLLDESGVIVVCSDPDLTRMLREFEWKNLFWHHRSRVVEHMKFFIVGHGLYEKALRPYVGMTAQGMLLEVGEAFHSWPADIQLAQVDASVAKQLADDCKYQRPCELNPIPLLGIPGWCADNCDPAYYDNTGYFRTGRRVRHASHA